MGSELYQGICMNILNRLLMCCKVSPSAGSPLQRSSSNHHYYRHITQGSPIDVYRFCSGTWILNGRSTRQKCRKAAGTCRLTIIILRKLSIRQVRCRDMIGGQRQIPAISFQGENEVAREATPRLSPSDVRAIVVPCRACMCAGRLNFVLLWTSDFSAEPVAFGVSSRNALQPTSCHSWLVLRCQQTTRYFSIFNAWVQT